MEMPNRNFADGNYRYGFQGQEKDDELKGKGNSINFGARMYDSRIARWFKTDAITKQYESTYSSFSNNPILYVDPDGNDVIIYLKNGSFLTYKPGMKLPDDVFTKQIVQSLNRIHATAEGEMVLNRLVESQRVFGINQTTYLIAPKGLVGAEFSLGKNGELDDKFEDFIKKKEVSQANKLLSEVDELFIGAFIGSYKTNWDYNNYDGVKMNLTIALGHELFHAFQLEKGRLDGAFTTSFSKKVGNVLLPEAGAVGFENYIRATIFEGTEYGDTRGMYSGDIILSFLVEPIKNPSFLEKLSKFWFGQNKLDIQEFKEGGKGYNIYKNNFNISNSND